MDTPPQYPEPETRPYLPYLPERRTLNDFSETLVSEKMAATTWAAANHIVLDLGLLDTQRQHAVTSAADRRSRWSLPLLRFMFRVRLHYIALACLVLSQAGIFLCQFSGGDQCYVLGHIYLSVLVLLYAVALSIVEHAIEPLVRPLLADTPHED